MNYRIKLDIFEGPFDLLLFLIRKHEVDIYDIPIHDITNQFLEYIELMKILDLEVAGEFIEMVAAQRTVIMAKIISAENLRPPRIQVPNELLGFIFQ